MGVCPSALRRGPGSARVSPSYAKDGVAIVTTELNMGSFMGHPVINQYLSVKDLGVGAYGLVQLCIDTHEGKLYAMKVVNKRRDKRRGVMGKNNQRRRSQVTRDAVGHSHGGNAAGCTIMPCN